MFENLYTATFLRTSVSAKDCIKNKDSENFFDSEYSNTQIGQNITDNNSSITLEQFDYQIQKDITLLKYEDETHASDLKVGKSRAKNNEMALICANIDPSSQFYKKQFSTNIEVIEITKIDSPLSTSIYENFTQEEEKVSETEREEQKINNNIKKESINNATTSTFEELSFVEANFNGDQKFDFEMDSVYENNEEFESCLA
jgi:hypothetical protein